MRIYKVTNIHNGKCYIGQTTKTLNERMWKHKGTYLHKDYSHLYFYQALKEYGLDSFTWETIDYASTIEELREKEKHWISFYNSFGEDGYNSTRGGIGASGHKHSDEMKRKISELNSGRKHTEEAKAKQSASMKGVNAGSNSVLAKLNEGDVKEIKRLIAEDNMMQKDIAKRFNVNTTTISHIKNGKRWAHVI